MCDVHVFNVCLMFVCSCLLQKVPKKPDESEVDLDSMSYEEILQLEERAGKVNIGLNQSGKKKFRNQLQIGANLANVFSIRYRFPTASRVH